MLDSPWVGWVPGHVGKNALEVLSEHRPPPPSGSTLLLLLVCVFTGWYQTIFLTTPYHSLERLHYFLWNRNPWKSSWRWYIVFSAAVSISLWVSLALVRVSLHKCRSSHHQHPSRVCNVSDRMGPVDRSVFPTALRQMLPLLVLAVTPGGLHCPCRWTPPPGGGMKALGS